MVRGDFGEPFTDEELADAEADAENFEDLKHPDQDTWIAEQIYKHNHYESDK